MKTIENNIKESPEELQSWLAHYARSYRAAFLQKQKCEKLMSRDSSKKWDSEKKSKMIRRLSTANDIIKKSESMIEQVVHKLSQLGIDVDIASGIEMLKS